MKIYNAVNSLPPGNYGVTVGNFDGIHIGHQRFIQNFFLCCRDRDLIPVVLIHSKHPQIVLKEYRNFLLTAVEVKINKIGMLGVSNVVLSHFDGLTAKREGDDWIVENIFSRNIKLVFAGHDFSIGKNSKITAVSLAALCSKFNVFFVQDDPVVFKGCTVSSSLIRECLRSGELEKAHELLGRSFSLRGIVVRGKSLGKNIGVPTANLKVNDFHIVPGSGVYQTTIRVDQVMYPSVTNIGFNPTFGDNNLRTIETHIIDFSKDIYGDFVELFFHRKIRSEKKFDSIDDLKKQIQIDIEKVNG